jgi:cytoskeleton protein RodZ
MDAAAENAPMPEEQRSLGALLAGERERQGLSRADIAQRLHMSASQVEALEGGDYARLPRGTFLRGFVRNYARILGLDPNATLRALAGDAPGEKAPAIVVPSQNIRFDPIGARLGSPYVKAFAIATTVIVLGFAALYWWFYVRPTAMSGGGTLRKSVAEAPRVESRKVDTPMPEALKAESLVAEPQKAEPPQVEPPRAEPAVAVVAKNAVPKAESPKPEAAKPATAKPENAVEAAPIDTTQVIAAGGGVVRLRFKGSSWVEIKDGRGKLLLSRVNAGGSEAEVSGRPPFSVIVGNAPEVELTYNNRSFDLEPYTRVAVARFTLPPAPQ